MSSALRHKLKSLSVGAIESSPEIQTWLTQFPEGNHSTAKMILGRLKFVSRDVYSMWLQRAIKDLPAGKTYALYSVRKLDEDNPMAWIDDGTVVPRPGVSQGSEDLVYSLVSNAVRSDKPSLLDHPSLTELREGSVHDYVLIDDSIGSGDRVSGFINAMLSHPTFLSWWSFGLVKIHVLSFARSRESEAKIIAKVRGSDHGQRKYRKSSKINFIGEMVYDTDWFEARWGENFDQIIELCRSQTKIPKWARLGYGEVMANTIFYHSVPNNLPGILWFKNDKWSGLFSGRTLPDWLLTLLDQTSLVTVNKTDISGELVQLLALVKRGVRSLRSIAVRLNTDYKYTAGMISRLQYLGLLTREVRLTAAGHDRLKQMGLMKASPAWDRSLYIPSSWCAGQATIQPPVEEESASPRLADSVEVSALTDGDVGQTSLERSDAKAATPPTSVMIQAPAVSRKHHDTDGPPGSKER